MPLQLGCYITYHLEFKEILWDREKVVALWQNICLAFLALPVKWIR